MTAPLSLNHELLDSAETVLEAPATFAACLNAHGLYNTLQFVLRLSPRVHELLDAVPPGIYPADQIDGETIQAYSTYLHETVHWWQHMGSTTGLVVSLCYPAQALANLTPLREVAKLTGLNKSLKQWSENAMVAGMPASDRGLQHANSAVNNAVDVEYFKLFIMQPELACKIDAERYFESVGHSFHIAYRLAVDLIASTVDVDCKCVPDVNQWSPEFERLTSERREGFYHGSPIRVAPVGLRALFEGQARFIQLQYLCFGGQAPSCEELREAGYFAGIYGDAFEAFLKLTGTEWPHDIDDPLVALFLLICDLAINPTAGFPCDIQNFETFILDTDPGIRFSFLCLAAKHNPELLSAIKDYSREEYVAVAGVLTSACGYSHPLRGLEEIARWAKELPDLIELMLEKETFAFGQENHPLRVILSHFVALSIEKLARPDFFCWAGVWMSGSRTSDEIQQIFLRHLSLFADRGDKEGIFPREMPGKDPENVFRTLNNFYGSNILYDLTRQWILQDGPFEYDYSWLTEEPSQKYAGWAKIAFEHLYGANPDTANVV